MSKTELFEYAQKQSGRISDSAIFFDAKFHRFFHAASDALQDLHPGVDLIVFGVTVRKLFKDCEKLDNCFVGRTNLVFETAHRGLEVFDFGRIRFLL